MENKRLDQILEDAIQFFKKNSLAKAKPLFEEVLTIDSRSADSHFYLGNIYHIQGELGKAMKSFNKVLRLDPGYTDASICLSVILNDIGRYEEAQAIFNTANDKVKSQTKGVQDPHINKKFSLKHFEIAEMYFTYNRYEEALFEYNKACGLDPENLDFRIKIAKVYSKKGYISKAFEELRRLKSDKPAYVPVRVALGLLHYGQGNTIEAQSEWETALLKDPSNNELKMYLSIASNATETNLNM